VTKKGNAINCDQCLQWFHQKCVGIGDILFDYYSNDQNLEWTAVQDVVFKAHQFHYSIAQFHRMNPMQ